MNGLIVLSTLYAALAVQPLDTAQEDAPLAAESSSETSAEAGTATPPPPTAELGLVLFGGYRYVMTAAESDEHAFMLDRGHLKAGIEWEGVSAKVVVEAVASATGGSIFGVADQSVLVRVRQAYAGYTDGTWVELRAGIVPTLTIPALQRAWQHRILSAVSPRRTKLLHPGDFGATARLRFPLKLGWLGVGLYNGDGYTAREFNDNKSLETTLHLRPLATVGDNLPLWLTASFIYGSTGPTNARADRLVGGLAWAGARFGVGATMAYAWGVADNGGRESMLVSGWLRTNPWAGLLLAARGSHWIRDIDIDGDTISRLTAAVGYRVKRPLEVFLSGEINLPGDHYTTAVPYDDGWSLSVLVKVALDGRFALQTSAKHESAAKAR